MIIFLDAHDHEDGLCTATAIGPHAILTAEHCNDGEAPDETITIDLSRKHYHLLAENADGHDHIIYLLDGPAFKNYLDPSELINVPQPKPYAPVVIYGDGLGQYPPREVNGFVDGKSDSADLSDVDQNDQALWYRLAIVPGDSGSAIYDAAGRVVGLVTYGFDAPSRRLPAVRAVGFALAFTPKAIQIAHTFSLDTAK